MTALVLSAGRDGSNLLVDCLNSLPGVRFAGEALNPALEEGLPGRGNSAAALRHLRRTLHTLGDGVCGLKIQFTQLVRHRLTVDDLHTAFPETRMLVLYRRSLAEQFVSLQLAQATGQWLLRDEKRRACARVRVEPEAYRKFCAGLRSCYASLLAAPWFGQTAMLLAYEDLAADPARVCRERVLPFLSLPVQEVKVSLVKQNVRALRETVENFEEVADLLSGTEATHDYASNVAASNVLPTSSV